MITDGTEALPSDLVMGLPLLSGLTIAFAHGDGRISVNGSRPASLHLPLEGHLIANVLALFQLNAPLAVIGEGGMTRVLEPRGRYGITLSGGAWTTGSLQFTGVTSTTPSGAVVHTVTRHGYSRISDGGPELYPSFYSAFYDFQFVAPIAFHWRSESNWEYSSAWQTPRRRAQEAQAQRARVARVAPELRAAEVQPLHAHAQRGARGSYPLRCTPGLDSQLESSPSPRTMTRWEARTPAVVPKLEPECSRHRQQWQYATGPIRSPRSS